MKILKINQQLSIDELKQIAAQTFYDLVKATVDIEKEIMVVGGELHSDQEILLLSEGSQQKNIWGINLYPSKFPEENWIEFDSMINIRPSFGNKSRGVDDPKIREKIKEIINKLIK